MRKQQFFSRLIKKDYEINRDFLLGEVNGALCILRKTRAIFSGILWNIVDQQPVDMGFRDSSSTESEYFTGDASLDIHSPGLTIAKTF